MFPADPEDFPEASLIVALKCLEVPAGLLVCGPMSTKVLTFTFHMSVCDCMVAIPLDAVFQTWVCEAGYVWGASSNPFPYQGEQSGS